MAKRRDRLRQSKQIQLLIDDNKYTKALQMIDEIPLEEVSSLGDLYQYADLYEKAERMDKEKEIYYIIYKRTGSRHALSRLLRLLFRLGDIEEARELYFAYEVAGDVTLDTYELRYLLAKAEGASRSSLIDILEELKKEEYTEEWGFQLARLYELEGEREKCIQECNDLKLWFGEGKIVDKAMELKARCEADDWEPPVEDELPEPIEPEMDHETVYAAPPVTVTEMQEDGEEESEEETLEEPPEESKDEAQIENEIANEIAEEIADIVEEENQAEPEEEPPIEESEPQELETQEPEEEQPVVSGSSLVDEMAVVSEPVVTARKSLAEEMTVISKPDESLLEDEPDDVSPNGIAYHTLKSAINHVRYDARTPHFVFAGGEERITLAVAKRITKELNNVGYVSVRSIVKITAYKLNQIDLSEQIEKIAGGCMLVTGASEMSKEAVAALVEVMSQEESPIVVMLSAPFDEMDCFLNIYPDLAEKLTYKIRM